MAGRFAPFEQDLVEALARGTAMFVAGTGVSAGTTGADKLTSWPGLLEDGLNRCRASDRHFDDAQFDVWMNLARGGGIQGMLAAAGRIEQCLQGTGDFRSWLDQSVGSLPITDPTLIEEIDKFGLPIATTNYDTLIERVTGRETVTLRAHDLVDVLRQNRYAVVHLHGAYDDPDSVVLSARSYADLLANISATAKSHFIGMLNRLIFLGFGDGLGDPNFSSLIAWLAQVFDDSTHFNYQLVREQDIDAAMRHLPSKSRVRVIPYGRSYDDLPDYLRTLREHANRSVAAPAIAPPPQPAFRPRIIPNGPRLDVDAYVGNFVGREGLIADVQTVATALMARRIGDRPQVLTRVFWLHGLGGMGKSWFLRRAVLELERFDIAPALVDWEPGDWSSPLTAPPTTPFEIFHPIVERVAQLYGAAPLDPYWEARANIQQQYSHHLELRSRFIYSLKVLEQLGSEWLEVSLFSKLSSDVLRLLHEQTTRQDIVQLEQILREKGSWSTDSLAFRHNLLEIQRNGPKSDEFFETWARAVTGPFAEDVLLVPARHLADALVDSLVRVTASRPLALMLDTCEYLSEDFERWIWYVVSRVLDRDGMLLLFATSRLKPAALHARGRMITGPRIAPAEIRIDALDENHLFTEVEIAEVLQRVVPPIDVELHLVASVQRETLGIPLAVRVLINEHESGQATLYDLQSRLPDEDSPASTENARRLVVEAVSARFLYHLAERPDAVEDFRDIIAIAIQKTSDRAVLRELWAVDDPSRRLTHLVSKYAILSGGDLHETVRQFVRMSWRENPPALLGDVARSVRAAHAKLRPAETEPERYIDWLINDINLESWESVADAAPRSVAVAAAAIAFGVGLDLLIELIDEFGELTSVSYLDRLSYVLDVSRSSFNPISAVSADDVEWLEGSVTPAWSPFEKASLDLVVGIALVAERAARPAAALQANDRLHRAISYFGKNTPQRSATTKAYLRSVVYRRSVDRTRKALELLNASNLSSDLDARTLAILQLFARLPGAAEAWSTAIAGKADADDYHLQGHFWGDDASIADYERSAAAFETATRLEPTNALYWSCWGEMEQRRGNQAEAKRLLENALRHDRDNPRILNSIAWSLYLQGSDLARAERYAARASRDSDEISYLHTLAAIKVKRTGRWDKARDSVLAVLARDFPQEPELEWNSLYVLFQPLLATHGTEMVADIEKAGQRERWLPLARALEEIVRSGPGVFSDLDMSLSHEAQRHFRALSGVA